MPAKKRKRVGRDPFDHRTGVESAVPLEKDRRNGLGDESFSALFDGSLWEIEPEKDLTPVTWVVMDDDWIPVEGLGQVADDPLFNWVLRDLRAGEVAAYGVERGWSTLAVHVQCIGELFGLSVVNGTMLCEQRKKGGSSRYFVKCAIDATL